MHSSILAWEIPWAEELAGYSLQARKESDTTEGAQHTAHVVWGGKIVCVCGEDIKVTQDP